MAPVALGSEHPCHSRVPRWPRETFVDVQRCCLLEPGRDVAVGVERDCDGTVTEPLAHNLRVDALAQHQARVGVAEGVQVNPLKPGALGRLRKMPE